MMFRRIFRRPSRHEVACGPLLALLEGKDVDLIPFWEQVRSMQFEELDALKARLSPSDVRRLNGAIRSVLRHRLLVEDIESF